MKKLKTFTLLIAIFIATNICAQPVALDPTFGENGITEIPQASEIYRIQFDKSGNIFTAGYNGNLGRRHLSIAKVNIDGVIDQNFGNEGVVTFLEYESSSLIDFKITDDNKLFLIGQFSEALLGNTKIILMQLNQDGSFDDTFGVSGKIITSNWIHPKVVNIENKDFMLVGDTYAISKYNYEGEPDESFGKNGRVLLTDSTTYRIRPVCIKILRDQSIFIAGNDILNPREKELAFCKLAPNGDLVTDFANNGIWKMNFFNDIFRDFESFVDAIEDYDGNIALLATIMDDLGMGSGNVIVCTFDSNGIMSNNFGTDGFYVQGMRSVMKFLQNGSNYLIGGYYNICSINQNGTLNMNFNDTGEFNFENFGFFDMKLQAPDKLIVGGTSNNNFAIVRLNIPFNEPIVSVNPYSSTFDTPITFPNPTKDYLYFKTEKKFKIMDLHGKVLLKSEKPVQSVNVSHLKTGVYFIWFEHLGVEKFVKE